jgi:hypothetical protein
MDRYRDTIEVGDIFMTARKSTEIQANVPHVVLDKFSLLRHNSYCLSALAPEGRVVIISIGEDYEFDLATIIRSRSQ